MPQPAQYPAGRSERQEGAAPPPSGDGRGQRQDLRRSCPQGRNLRGPLGSGPNSSSPQYFTLVKIGGEWRISAAPPVLLLTQAQFADDYDLRNLYFFDPTYRYLVPDPVYVPLQASASTPDDQAGGLPEAPPEDWLAEGATQTAFPAGAKVTSHAGRRPGHGERHRGRDDQQGPAGPDGVATAVDAGRLGPGRLPGDFGRAERERQAVLSVRQPGQPGGDPVRGQLQAGHRRQRHPAGQLVYYLDGAGDVYSSSVGVAGVAGKQTQIARIGAGVLADRGLSGRQVPGRPARRIDCTSGRSTARWRRSRAPATRR